MPGPRSLLLALGFCTRLAPSRLVSGEELARSLGWFPLVGLLLGVLLALGGLLAQTLGLLQGTPLVLAVLLVGLNIYLTRGLHWDGWADLWDGWGSNAQGDRFWQILKDSRAGVFAVLGLGVGLLAQTALWEALVIRQAWAALLWCPVLGRVAIVLLAVRCRHLGRPGMGQAFLAAARPASLLPALGACVLAGLVLVPWTALLCALLLLGLGLWRLERLAARQGGCNGDFLGAAAVLGELCAALGWVLAL